tara:strand:- start:131 stop:919 length:789 start_codon:yes stop_codon:yes gene_type:complete
MNDSALITGAATRIGRAMALNLAKQGVDLVVHYMNSKIEAQEVVELARSAGVMAYAIKADLLNDKEVEGLISKAVARLQKPLNILINNASIFEYDNIGSVSIESWERHIGSNLKAPLFLIQQFSKQVTSNDTQDQNKESLPTANIVNIVDQRVMKRTPEFISYTIAKVGLWTLTQTAAQALAPKIRVNAIGPGPTLKGHRQSNEHFKKQRMNTILERGSSTEEIVEALNFILNAPSMTGQLICIDGGQHLTWQTPDILGLEP